ncbi:MAG TPA: cytochrome P450 [Steroidobacteraceae bacterium]|nr:cytochrome P450 [Steroidobacteraceae bacterium]
MAAIPEFDTDIFSRESVRRANAVDDRLREFAPAVRLPGGDVVMLARFEHVSAGLKDWRTFSSTSRPWHDPQSVRPELLLTDDPPKHTGVRAVVSNALSPAALNRMAGAFRADARAIVGGLRDREGESIDAVADITQAFVYKVLPDLIGLPLAGRQHMSAFGHMVWATMGPMNELFHEAMRDTGGEVLAWAGACCKRENLAPGSLGMAMYEAADRGEVTPAEAELLVGILLSAAADTTVMTLANTLRAFSEFPQEFQRVRADPALVRAAFEESLRWDSPSRMAGRIAMRDVEIDDYVIPRGTRCGLMFAAANRDPRRWQEPRRFDVKRHNAGHLGFGSGVHACVGRVLALLEADALLGAVAESVTRIEPAGDPEPWMTTIGHGPAKLPLRLYFDRHAGQP